MDRALKTLREFGAGPRAGAARTDVEMSAADDSAKPSTTTSPPDAVSGAEPTKTTQMTGAKNASPRPPFGTPQRPLPRATLRQRLSGWFFRKLRGGVSNYGARKGRVVVETLADAPPGFPRVAAFINSDPNFHMYRAFGQLRSRLLLHQQDVVMELEEQLADMDAADAISAPARLLSREGDTRVDTEREELLAEARESLKTYDEMLQREAQAKALPRPTTRNYRAVLNFIENHDYLSTQASQFIYRREDFVMLSAPREDSWLDGVIEDVLGLLPRRIMQPLVSSPEQRIKAGDDQNIYYYSKTRLGTLAKLISTAMGIFFISCPVFLLFELNLTRTIKLVVVLAFMLVLPGILGLITKAKRHEVFAASAAYCAVLVVFLGNIDSTKCPSSVPGIGKSLFHR